MIESGHGINHIRYNNSKFHPPVEDQGLIEFSDNYVFKTNPSFQLSQQVPKHNPSGENWFITKQQHTNQQEQTTGYQRKKRNRQNNNKQITDQTSSLVNPQLLLLQSVTLQKQVYQLNQQVYQLNQQVCQLNQQVNKLNHVNVTYEIENEKLKKYIEFLQDYNLKLKKELMTALRRRSIQDQLQHINMNTNINKLASQSLQKSPRQQMFQSKYIPNNNNITSNVFKTIESRQNQLRVPQYMKQPYQQQQCLNTNNNRTINHDNNNNNNYHQDLSALTNKYLGQSHQIPSKYSPYYWAYKNSKKHKNHHLNKKIIPTSLQSSMLGRQNNLLEQQPYPYSNHHHYLNSQIPITKNTRTPYHDRYLQNIKIHQNQQNNNNKYFNNNLNQNQKKFICQKCLENNPYSNKSKHQSRKNSKTRQKLHKNKNNPQFTCQIHSHNQSKKSKTKSTIPTRSKTFQQSSRSKSKSNNSQNNINLNSSKKRNVKYGQKVTISQFCI